MQIKIIILSLIAVFSQTTFSQCVAVNVQNVSNFTPLAIDSLLESDGLRNGPDYKGATLFYPINTDKNLKSIVLVPGYLATEKSIKYWAKHFASRGFICMTIETNKLGENPSMRASALIDGMETLRQENEKIASPLHQKIDKENIAAGGWYMGGGGAQLAAKIENRIKAVFVSWKHSPQSANDMVEWYGRLKLLNGGEEFQNVSEVGAGYYRLTEANIAIITAKYSNIDYILTANEKLDFPILFKSSKHILYAVKK